MFFFVFFNITNSFCFSLSYVNKHDVSRLALTSGFFPNWTLDFTARDYIEPHTEVHLPLSVQLTIQNLIERRESLRYGF